MKKIVLAMALVAGVSAAKAQDYSVQNAVKINPLSLFVATGNVSYERAVNHNQSVQLGVFYSGISISGLKYSGFGITPEYRIYFAGRAEALNGVYAAPFLRYQNFSFKEKKTTEVQDPSSVSFSSIGGGATLGWQKAWESGFVLDIFAGPSYSNLKFKNNTDEDDHDIKIGANGIGVRTGITLGFSF